MAEQINILFGVETLEDPRNIVLDGGPHPPVVGVGSVRSLSNDFVLCFYNY